MKNLLGYALGLAVLLTGCSESKKAEAPQTRELAMMAPPPMAEERTEREDVAIAAVASPPSDSPAEPGAAAITVIRSRLLIYHAELRLKVDNLAHTNARLDSLVRRSGGYLSASDETRGDDEWRQDLRIRVQPSRFQGLLHAINGLGTVESKKLTTDDVTTEHADVAARLRTKRAVEQRYVALLDRAKKISEILEIEEKIGEVREAIESTESRLKTLNDEVAYSTITLTCYQPLSQPTPDAPVVSLGSRLLESFYGGWTLLTSLLVGIVALWPLLILGSLGWWAGRRWYRTRLAKAD
jgi:hypothetical protein